MSTEKVKYNDDELKEFEEMILHKLEVAKKTLRLLYCDQNNFNYYLKGSLNFIK